MSGSQMVGTIWMAGWVVCLALFVVLYVFSDDEDLEPIWQAFVYSLFGLGWPAVFVFGLPFLAMQVVRRRYQSRASK